MKETADQEMLVIEILENQKFNAFFFFLKESAQAPMIHSHLIFHPQSWAVYWWPWRDVSVEREFLKTAAPSPHKFMSLCLIVCFPWPLTSCSARSWAPNRDKKWTLLNKAQYQETAVKIQLFRIAFLTFVCALCCSTKCIHCSKTQWRWVFCKSFNFTTNLKKIAWNALI